MALYLLHLSQEYKIDRNITHVVLTHKLEKARRILQQPSGNPQKVIDLLSGIVKQGDVPWVAYHLMGMAWFRKRSFEKASSFFEQAIEVGSDNPGTYLFLSKGLLNQGLLQKAERSARRAVKLKEDYFEGWMFLGEICRAQGKLNEALTCYYKANQIDPKSAEVAFRIACIYGDQSNDDKALQLFDIAIKIDESYLNAYAEKANVLIRKKEYGEAESCLKEALQMDPQFIKAEAGLAELAKLQGDYGRAIAIYKRLVSLQPDVAPLRVNYALCLLETGQYDESEKQYLKAFRQDPSVMEALSNYLMGLHYNPRRTREEIFEAHLLYDRQYAPAQKPDRHVQKSVNRNKTLKLGLLSGGFRSHPVGWMITSALEHLPKDQFEIYCYTTNGEIDSVTRRIYERSDTWRSVIGFSEEVIARMMREDEIDILVELSGHSADNRLRTVYHNPAPVIVKWVGGLFNTTGLKNVDFLITDHNETPEGDEKYYTEKLVRMPDGYICFHPPVYAPDVGELPALKNGYVTFGCFNNPTKVNEKTLEVWAEILKKVPESRLFLKSNQYDTAAVRERVLSTLASFGIRKGRVFFEGVSPHAELLNTYNRVDIALDPWPYSGGLTTCEALWMGVPVLTTPGPTFAGRHSTTHLMNAGYPEWVYDSREGYVAGAVSLASDLPGLHKVRKEMRERVSQSPLCDAPRFAAHLSKAFREMWGQYADGVEKNNDLWQSDIDVEPLPESEIERLSKEGFKKAKPDNSSHKGILNGSGRNSSDGRFLHFCFNHVYAKSLSDLIEYVNHNSKQEHWLYVEKHRAIAGYGAEISSNPHSTYFDFREHLAIVVNRCLDEKVDGIFMHGLFFDWQKEIIRQVAEEKHIGWIIWGGDLYNPVQIGDNLSGVIEFVDTILPIIDGDLQLFEKNFGRRTHHSFGYTYPGLYGELPKMDPKDKHPVVIVGNSGDPSNHHIEVLNNISEKRDISEYRLILPVSYNLTQQYEQKLIETVNRLGLQKQTILLKKFIAPEEYFKLMRDSSILITAHHRQQAVGNILMSVYSANPTFLRKEIRVNGEVQLNPTWEFMTRQGLPILDYEQFLHLGALADVERMTPEQVQNIQELIQSRFGINKRAMELEEVSQKILDRIRTAEAETAREVL